MGMPCTTGSQHRLVPRAFVVVYSCFESVLATELRKRAVAIHGHLADECGQWSSDRAVEPTHICRSAGASQSEGAYPTNVARGDESGGRTVRWLHSQVARAYVLCHAVKRIVLSCADMCATPLQACELLAEVLEESVASLGGGGLAGLAVVEALNSANSAAAVAANRNQQARSFIGWDAHAGQPVEVLRMGARTGAAEDNDTNVEWAGVCELESCKMEALHTAVATASALMAIDDVIIDTR